jgi:zinc transporter ZupT
VGAWLEGIPRVSRAMVLIGGIVLVGMSFFWVLPEIAGHFGWVGGLFWVAAGFGLLWLVGRKHDHSHCEKQLHGFAIPLLLASGLHSFMDGWSLAASRQRGFEDLQTVFLVGIALHKLPEGLALGGILRASMSSWLKVAPAAFLAQAMCLVGYAVASFLAPHAGSRWLGAMLGIAGGTFLYLGYHALETVLHPSLHTPLHESLPRR